MSTPLSYHLRVLLLKMVAENLFKHGLLMTGVQMYEQVGMIEECIEGLLAAGHKDRALKLSLELFDKQAGDGSPRLLSFLAELQNDPEGYERAW
jgi:hypothetical protein